MRRYPAYDPPEYLEWTPGPDLVERWNATLDRNPRRAAVVASLPEEALLGLYRNLLRTRLLDIGLKRWVRQGVISKAWLGTGEEAVTVGAVQALDPERDWVCPMIRNAGACPMMGMPEEDVFRGYLATPDSTSGGRDLHVGSLRHRVLQPISHMGTNVAVMGGVAMGLAREGRGGVALTWIGDGATKTGECHEGLNLAAVQRLPAVFILQDNQVALGTPASRHGAGELNRFGEMYGLETREADGNHVLDVLAAVRIAVAECRAGRGPAVIHARTFRMGGHATHDEREARATFSGDLFREWGKRDPLGSFEVWLESRGISPQLLEEIEGQVTAEVEAAAETALRSREVEVDPRFALFAGVSEGPPLVGLSLRPV
jgi:2-oxoisovalerate dehydrogenase E1 component